MNIGINQILQARERRSHRERSRTTCARQSDEEAFRRQQRQRAASNVNANNNVMVPALPPVEDLDEDPVDEEQADDNESFISAADLQRDSPNDANIDDGAYNDNDGTDYRFEADGGELDYAAEEYNVNDRIMHFLGGMRITIKTRPAVEIAVGIHSLSVVVSDETSNSTARNEKLHKVYIDTLRAFDLSCFEPPSLLDTMLNKLYNAQQTITGGRLYAKCTEWRSEIRNSYQPKLPNNLSTLPSGTSMRDAYNKFILQRYKEAHVSSCCC